MFGDPEVVTGGKALPYYASYRVALRKAGKVKDASDGYDDEGRKTKVNSITGIKIRATLEKSKLSAPSKEALFTFDLSLGCVDEVGYLIAQGLTEGIIKHEGKSWWLEESEKQVGLEKFRDWLAKNQKASAQIRAHLVSNGASAPVKKREGSQKSK
jgi:recombination protein RecA